MRVRSQLSSGRLELGAVTLAIVVGGGLAFGQATAAHSALASAGGSAPVTDAPYFDRGWELDDAAAPGAPVAGTPSRDHGWEVDDGTPSESPLAGTPSRDQGWEVDDAPTTGR